MRWQNCSLNSIPDEKKEPGAPRGCNFDGLTIESSGLPPGSPAIRVYAGSVKGTTIIAASSPVYSEHGVVDAEGKPTGEWKQTSGAGWLMSGAAKADALSFLPSGAEKPARVICAPPPFTLLAAQPPSIA